MSSDNVYIEVDEFSTTIANILEDVNQKVVAKQDDAVREACKFGRKECKNNAKNLEGIKPRVGVDTWDRYCKGFAWKVNGKNEEVVGEIGNKELPGLVHLIEKGHAIMGDGAPRARAFNHIDKAAQKTFKKFEEEILQAVDMAL